MKSGTAGRDCYNYIMIYAGDNSRVTGTSSHMIVTYAKDKKVFL